MQHAIDRVLELFQEGIAAFIAQLPLIIVAGLVFFAIYRVSIPVDIAIRRLLRGRLRSRSVVLLIARLTRWSIVFGGFLLAATIALPDFTPSELLSVLGFGGVAIGFAFRDVLQNFLAGILILLNEPFVVGDQIVFGGYEGTVEEIEVRATVLRTYDNVQVVIHNGVIYADSVVVNTAYDKRRSSYDVGIGYDDDIATAQEICLQVMREIEGVLKSPEPMTVMMEMGDFALIFRVYWWTNSRQADVLRVQDRVLRTIKNRLTEEGFTIPFPIRTVYFHNEDESHVNQISS